VVNRDPGDRDSTALVVHSVIDEGCAAQGISAGENLARPGGQPGDHPGRRSYNVPDTGRSATTRPDAATTKSAELI